MYKYSNWDLVPYVFVSVILKIYIYWIRNNVNLMECSEKSTNIIPLLFYISGPFSLFISEKITFTVCTFNFDKIDKGYNQMKNN